MHHLFGDSKINLADIGASGGIHHRWKRFKENVITIGFEPDARAFKSLKQDPNSIWLNTALSSKNESRSLNITRWQTNTSFFKPNYKLLNTYFFPRANDFEIIDVIEVQCRRLDDVLSERGVSLDTVKLDTQGSELSILKGASDQLELSVFAVETEVEFVELYEGQPLFRDIDYYMSAKGFILIDCGNLAYLKARKSVNIGGKKGQLVSADALYFKSVESINKIIKTGDSEKLARIIMICLAYGYPDYAIEICCDLKKTDLINHEFLNRCISLLSRQKTLSKMIPGFPGRSFISRLLFNLGSLFDESSHVAWLNPLGNRIEK